MLALSAVLVARVGVGYSIVVLWIWWLTRDSHKWATGPLSRYFTFSCIHCAAMAMAVVQYFGHGAARNNHEAAQRAFADAERKAYQAVNAAACPRCGRLQPNVGAELDQAEKRIGQRRARKLPIAGGLSAIALIGIGIFAVPDLAYSPMLMIVALTTAAAVFMFVLGMFSQPIPVPSMNPDGVWFSHDGSGTPESWTPALAGERQAPEQPNRSIGIVSYVGSAVALLCVVGALVMWRDTYRKVYVVSSEARGQTLTVQIDGNEVGQITNDINATDDAPFDVFEVRTNETHRLVVDAQGHSFQYELKPSESSHGWVVAPDSLPHGLCLADITWYYGGTPPATNNDRVVNVDSDLVILDHRYDFMFTPPPGTVQTKQSQTSRTTLRGLDCESLEDTEGLPWRSVSRTQL